ncbi:MAG: hypothetical protein ACTHMT_03195 [Verrucomicrobiota bacterium]|jgi:hypothetical protein
MPENKGKPSGKYAEDKTDPGRKGDYQRTGWPEESLSSSKVRKSERRRKIH